MVARNKLLEAPPYPVEQTLQRLGANLRTARLRRNLTLDELAEKIGTGVRAIADAERGKPSTGVAVYMAMLWAFDLLHYLDDVAAPEKDEEGLRLSRLQDRDRSRPARGGLSNDF